MELICKETEAAALHQARRQGGGRELLGLIPREKQPHTIFPVYGSQAATLAMAEWLRLQIL